LQNENDNLILNSIDSLQEKLLSASLSAV